MKKTLVFGLILAICCSSVFALPKKASSEVQPEVMPVTEPSKVSSEPVTETSEPVTETSPELETLLTNLEGKFVITGSTLKNLQNEFANFKGDYEQLKTDYSSLKDEMSKVNRTRFFLDLGAAFSFKEEGLAYGMTGDMGLKFGKGFKTQMGITYMMEDIMKPSWNLSNMIVTTTVGWEW